MFVLSVIFVLFFFFICEVKKKKSTQRKRKHAGSLRLRFTQPLIIKRASPHFWASQTCATRFKQCSAKSISEPIEVSNQCLWDNNKASIVWPKGVCLPLVEHYNWLANGNGARRVFLDTFLSAQKSITIKYSIAT